MKNSVKIISWITVVLLLGGMVVYALGILWLNIGKLTPLKQKVLSRIPTPIAIVGSRPVWSTEYFKRLAILRAYQPKGMDEQTYRNTVYDRLLQEKAEDLLTINSTAETYSTSIYIDQGGKLLNEWQNKRTSLQIWYNNQQQFNPEAFQKIERLQKLLADGISFEELAADNSQELLSKTFNGDLGYLEAKDLLPEILQAADSMKIGEVKQVVSREGLHLIKLEGRDNLGQDNGQRIHLKQIYVSESGFENWLNAEINKIKIIKLINI